MLGWIWQIFSINKVANFTLFKHNYTSVNKLYRHFCLLSIWLSSFFFFAVLWQFATHFREHYRPLVSWIHDARVYRQYTVDGLYSNRSFRLMLFCRNWNTCLKISFTCTLSWFSKAHCFTPSTVVFNVFLPHGFPCPSPCSNSDSLFSLPTYLFNAYKCLSVPCNSQNSCYTLCMWVYISAFPSVLLN